MNLSSRTAAGRSRSADGGVFLRPSVVHATDPDPSGPPAASPHAWKRVLQEKIWSVHGPKGLAARTILLLLVWHADARGRAWLGVQTIANKVGAGSLRTVRHALDALVRDGWLASTPQTWATLTAEQTAAGRPAPRRGDVGQAPNLYVVLDGLGNAVTSEFLSTNPSPTRPGLARISTAKQAAPRFVSTPGHIDLGSPGQKCSGEPRADLHHDPDPVGSRSRIESVERARRTRHHTHDSTQVRQDDPAWVEAWHDIVAAHVDKTNAVYGVPPLPPDLKRDQRQALAECLRGAALDLRSKLRERTGVEQDERGVQRELVERVMQLYFKRDVEHLRRVKHALRDLPREFHARITEAVQMLVRERHDATRPRRPAIDPPIVETNDRVDRVERPVLESARTMQSDTAREARRLLDALGSTSPREECLPRPTPKGANSRPLDEDKPDGRDKPITSVYVLTPANSPRGSMVCPRPVETRALRRLEFGEEPDEIDLRRVPI